MARGQAKRATKIKREPKSEAERARERVSVLAERIGIPIEQRGSLVEGKVVDLAGELGPKMTIIPVLINRGGTAVDRWINGDKTGLFDEPQQRAIRYTQSLWLRAQGQLRAIDHTRDIVDNMVEGISQQEALDELKRLKERTPRPFWEVYENVCRFDEEAGTAGARLATNSRSAIDAAKTTVAFTASLIAMWRRL